MTPAARYAAAADLLDEIAAGAPAERVLTNWGRRARYAGSGDRAAVRDIAFDVVRRWRSTAVRGGGQTGRARLLGLLRQRGEPTGPVFSGTRHAMRPLTPNEQNAGAEPTGWAALDMPDWLGPQLEASLGLDAERVCMILRDRAPVFLRVRTDMVDRKSAIAALATDGIGAEPHALAETALVVTEGARRVRNSTAYLDGQVELQDAASQAVCAALPTEPGMTVLDYCAGGGGKALAIAARGATVIAHDRDPARMRDLGARATRAGTPIRQVTTAEAEVGGPFDLVLVDVPCSGSGAWRRQPEGKWRLTQERLRELLREQARIMREACALVRPGGVLAYATCSLLDDENAAQADRFVAEMPGWERGHQRKWSPLDGGDGFFLALFRQVE